jgi:HK97 family phage portal protein
VKLRDALRWLIPGRERTAAAPQAPVQRDYSLAWPTPMLWGLFGGGGSNTGVPVTPLSALQSAAVYGCVLCLAEDIGKLPIEIRRRVPGGGFEIDATHPLGELFARPNKWQTPMEFWSYMVTGVKLRGNAIAAIKRDWDGSPLELIPLNWDRVSVLLSPKGWLYYLVSHPMVGDGVTLHQDDVLHIRNICVDGGYLGMSAIAVAQDVVGLALATQQHGATLFRQGTQLAGFLKTAGVLSPEAAKRIAEDWKNIYGGVQNANKVAVLEQGMEFVKLGMTNEDAQFLESRKFSLQEVCRLFRVPPHKVQDLSNAHFNNLEQSEKAYVNDALQPTAARIEQACERSLLFEAERGSYQIRFNFEELLRGDFKTRMEGYQIALLNGIFSRNEIRLKEGASPVPGGDEFRVPLNTGSAGGTGQAGSEPSKPATNGGGDQPSPGNAQPITSETADQAVI